MTGLNLIRPHLTTENLAALLSRCKHQSKRQIEFLCAQMTLPVNDVRGEGDTGEVSSGEGAKGGAPYHRKRGKSVGLPAET